MCGVRGPRRAAQVLAQVAPIGWHAIYLQCKSEERNDKPHPQCTVYELRPGWKALDETLCSPGFAGLTRSTVHIDKTCHRHYESCFRRTLHCDQPIVKKLLPQFHAARGLLSSCTNNTSEGATGEWCSAHILRHPSLRYVHSQSMRALY